MDDHRIQISMISLANPWLDFFRGENSSSIASITQELNDELQSMCEASKGRLYGLASLPLFDSKVAIAEVIRLKKLNKIKGLILGTSGGGHGLDHAGVRDVLKAIADNDFTVFLHPHYGVGNEHFHDSGHALFLALGFPFETTVSVARLIVSGTLDDVPKLKILVAHAGAALPSLIGRLDSCVEHDSAICNRLLKAPSEYFKDLYFDAISYSSPALQTVIDLVGSDRIVFGTDNPFFPPPGVKEVIGAQWISTNKVYKAIEGVGDSSVTSKILSENAQRIFNLQ